MKKRSVWLLSAGIWGTLSCLWGIFALFQLTNSDPGTWSYDMGVFVAGMVIMPWLLLLLLGTIMGFLACFKGKRWMALLSAAAFLLAFLFLVWLMGVEWWYMSLPPMLLSLIGFFQKMQQPR